MDLPKQEDAKDALIEEKQEIDDLPRQVEEADDSFSSGQMKVLERMLTNLQSNITETLQVSLNETLASMVAEKPPHDDQHQMDVTKILRRDEEIKERAKDGEDKVEEPNLDQEIEDLANELDVELDEALISNKGKAQKAQDMSATIAKSWQNARMRDDISHFPSWHRRGMAYFNAAGLYTMGLLDPFSVPTTLDDWERADRVSKNLLQYKKFALQVVESGEVTARLSKTDGFSVLNAAYLATVKYKRGLRSAVTAVVESAIDFHTMKSCLLRSDELSHPAAARHMFFSVFNYFMLNTEETRLHRLSILTNDSKLEDLESIKNFADRLRSEASVLNMMSKGEVVSDQLLFSIFKKAVLNKYENSTTKYYTELRLLQAVGENNFPTLAQRWNTVWLEEKGKVGFPTANAFKVTTQQNFGKDRKTSNKVVDKQGKFVCFQFAKNGECSYGNKCKYSHEIPANVTAFVTEADMDSGMIQQAYAMGKSQSNKFRRSSTSRQGPRRPQSSQDKATSAYQSAIRRHRSRTQLPPQAAAVNLAEVQVENQEDKEEGNDHSIDYEINSVESVTDQESDSSSETCFMATMTPVLNLDMTGEPKSPKKNTLARINGVGILDSGASIHLCGDRTMFVGKFRACNVAIKCANNSQMVATECGDVAIQIGPNKTRVWLRDVLYVPKAPMLISIARLAEDCGINVIFRKRDCMLVRDSNDGEICTISRDGPNKSHCNNGQLYGLKFEVPTQTKSVTGSEKCRRELVFNAYHTYVPRAREINLLHARYNHACEYYIKKLHPQAKGKLKWCDACVVGGLSKRRFKKKTRYMPYEPNSTNSAHDTQKLMLARNNLSSEVGPDISGNTSSLQKHLEKFGSKMSWDAKTSPVVSVRGNKYAFVGICTITKVSVALLGQNKSDFVPGLKSWLARYHNKYQCYPVQLLFDQGGENTDGIFLNWLRSKGIEVRFSTTKSSNQNAQVERKIRTVWTGMLKLLAYSAVPFQFWCFAFVYATLVGNHIPHRALNFVTPLEQAGFTTVHDRIFTWGCEAWHMDPNRLVHEAKSKRGVLLGLDEEVKGWQILDIETRKVVVSRNVVFNENRFPFKDHLQPCLIMLKFGTWPKTVRHETISTNTGVDPATVVEAITGDARNGGEESSEDNEDEPVSGTQISQDSLHDETKTPANPGEEEAPQDKTTITPVDQNNPHKVDETVKMPKDAPPKETLETQEPYSPIITDSMIDDWSSPILTPPTDNIGDLNCDPQSINLDTPPLGKGAEKRWIKFKDNHYYNSMSPRKLSYYEHKLVADSQSLTDSKPLHSDKIPLLEKRNRGRPRKSKNKLTVPVKLKPTPLTPVPEDTVNGEPAWSVKEIKNSKPSSCGDGTKDYYVRWKGSWPDEWLHESHLEGCSELLEEFNRPKRKYKKRGSSEEKPNLRVPIVPRRRSKRIKNIELNTQYTFKACTEFPSPPDYSLSPHNHWVPSRISEDKVIADAYQVIDGLVQDERFEKKPENRREMLKGNRVEEYIAAEEKELYELDLNGTFQVVKCPPGRKPIPCRWVYDIKRNSAGNIERFKARLVVQGFRQIEGIDFQNTFSAVSQMRTFRLIVAISVEFNLRITQYDISNAFLHAELDKEIYMTFPPGYSSDDPTLVFKLLKGLYGLKQASRLWNKLLERAFRKAGLQLATTEPGVFFVKDGPLCLLNLHVDDYNIATADEDLRKKIEGIMSTAFSVKALGELELFLGIVIEKVDQDGRVGFKLHQKPYHIRAVEKYLNSAAKPTKTPAEVSVKLTVLDCPETDEKGRPIDAPDWPYMNVGGTMMYSACATRPDISQRVTQLARYNKNPGKSHVKAQKHLLRYLKDDPGKGIMFTRAKTGHDVKAPIKVIAFCDSDWAGCSDSRRSTIGYTIQVAGGPVTWKSQLKKTLALSSCEAEFMALSEVAREIIWVTRFLDEVGIAYEVPRIYCDSQSAIYWSEDPVQHQRNKHIELKYYFIRDVVSRGLVKIYKINTLYNISDLLTKPATKVMTETLVPPMMGHDRPTLEQ